MTDFLDTDLNNVGSAGVIAELAEETAAREILHIDGEAGTRKAFILGNRQKVHEIDLEPTLPNPLRKRGTVKLDDQGSFCEYVGRHSLVRATTLWADIDKGTVTAVFDDHAAHVDKDTVGAPGWGQHRAVLTLVETEDWEHWTKFDGKTLMQSIFAEHLEDGADAIRVPDAATMLEIAQTFQAKNNVAFESAFRLTSGEVQLQFKETIAAKSGQRGNIEIPAIFTLGLQPFEGGEHVYAVDARFRYRITEGTLGLAYKMIRPDKVRREAFNEIISMITEGTGLPVLSGTPRP